MRENPPRTDNESDRGRAEVHVAKQTALITRQQKGMEVLTARVKEQAAQIQRVSAELETTKPAPQTVLNDQ
jgi:hypothetical protein